MSDVKLEIAAGIARVTLARPEVRNALRTATCQELALAIAQAGESPDVRVVVVTGEGGSFCAGADLADPTVFTTSGDRRAALEHHIDRVFQPIVRAIRHSARPVVAAVSGAAVGFGFDLALACDLRVAAEDARVGPTFGRIGLVCDGGGTHTLQRLVGPTRALEWILTAVTRTAREVADWGIFNRVVPAAELEAATAALVRPLVEAPPLAVRAARALVYAAQSNTYEQALAAERDAQVELLLSRDFGEGVEAFFTRRAPAFKGE